MRPAQHPFLEHDGFLAFAHRGGALESVENTMAAFQKAIDLGFRYIETDVQATRDGEILAFHDDTFDRLTNLSGPVGRLDYAALRDAHVSEVHAIPRLEDVLGAWPNLKVNIDIKSDVVVGPLVDVIKRTNALNRICVGSFSGMRTAQLRAVFGPALCTSMGPMGVALLRARGFGIPFRPIDANCAQVPIFHRGIKIVDRRFVRSATELGLQVHVWTVDDIDTMNHLIDLGVHGIMTDRPTDLKHLLQSRSLWLSEQGR